MTTAFARPIWAYRLFLVVVVACAAGCAISPTSDKWREKSDALLAQQQGAAAQAMATPGRKVIVATFALNSDSTAFQGDAVLARDALRSINPKLPVFLLSNQREFSDIAYPFATKTNIAAVLGQIARRADKETLVVLLFTSHGLPNRLSVKIANGEYLQEISADELKQYLEPLRPLPVVVILSACFSGSFVPALAADNRIIMASAARDRSSFGCQPDSQGTYFIQALLRDVDASKSWAELFTRARGQVAETERSQRLRPSQPQIFVGKAMGGTSGVPLRQLLSP